MKPEIPAKPVAKNLNKLAYAAFLLTGVYFVIIKDFSQAVIFWGLALVFDPFDTGISFAKRPFYQRAWLIIHLSITMALFVLMLVGK